MPADPLPHHTASSARVNPALMQTLREHGSGNLVFGRFRLLRELGVGGMAVVWLARDERLGFDVALKFLVGMVATDPEALNELRREITRGLQLTHPGIVRLYDLAEDSQNGLAAITMEYISGSTLAEEKARQSGDCFDVTEPLLTWTRELCDVLTYMHEKAKVVHRDIKPRNIMLTSSGEVKVADFGIAGTLCESHSRLTQKDGSSGTPLYMSPQQALGRSPRASDDVYAFGATLYELVTSKPPFFRGNVAIVLNQVASVVPPSMAERRREFGLSDRASIPTEWEDVVAACLAKESGNRPASMREVADLLGLGTASSTLTKQRTARGASEPLIALARTQSKPRPEEATPPVLSPAIAPLPGAREPIAPQQALPPRRKRRWIAACLSALVVGTSGFTSWWLTPSRHHDARSSTVMTSQTVDELTATLMTPFVNSLGMRFVPVTIVGGPTAGRRILFSVWDTRVQDYAAYCRETQREIGSSPFAQGATHPAINVSWEDAVGFCNWLSGKEHRIYRLPSDHEWSCAAGIGEKENATQSPEEKAGKLPGFPWGEGFPPPANFGNYAPSLKADIFEYSSPVGSFAANHFGLFDMSGNVWQWCADWYDPAKKEYQPLRVLRGGSWVDTDEARLLSSARFNGQPEGRYALGGFRCVLVAAVGAQDANVAR